VTRARTHRGRVFAGAAAVLAGLAGMVALAADRGKAAAAAGSADLVIAWTKTPKATLIRGGTVVRYVVTVRNAGPDAAGNVTLDLGVVTQKAEIFSGVVSDGTHCTKEDLIPGLAFFVHCPMGTLGAGASKSATLQLRALKGASKTGGAILVATMSASSDDSTDPDDSNSSFIYLPGDPIQYSITAGLGGGKTTARNIRAKVLIAPYGSQTTSSVRYRVVNVFNAPPGARVTLTTRGVVETGTTNRSGKLRSRKLVNRTLPVGSIFSVRVTKPGRTGDLLRIKVIAGGAKLAGRLCIPPGGQPRSTCR
jgi:hypothetical protein